MKFKFCGEADCPDWILAEINTLSKLSSVKLKLLAQVVANGIVNPPIDLEKAEKLFADSKLDINVDLKACISCITHIIKSAVRFNCDSNALHSELQQLGLPREHSTSLKKVTDEYSTEIATKLKNASLKVNPLKKCEAKIDEASSCVTLDLDIGDHKESVLLSPYTLDVLIDTLKSVKPQMVDLQKNPYVI